MTSVANNLYATIAQDFLVYTWPKTEFIKMTSVEHLTNYGKIYQQVTKKPWLMVIIYISNIFNKITVKKNLSTLKFSTWHHERKLNLTLHVYLFQLKQTFCINVHNNTCFKHSYKLTLRFLRMLENLIAGSLREMNQSWVVLNSVSKVSATLYE